MIEKKVVLEEIDPIDIYGVNNKLFDLLKSYFPKLKAVARGSEILLKGTSEDIELFEKKLNDLINKKRKKNILQNMILKNFSLIPKCQRRWEKLI